MTVLIALLVLVFLAGLTKALLDFSSINGFKNKWWNKGDNWKNKWKLNGLDLPIVNSKRPFYYLFLYKPNYVEKFPYSSTILVSFTDGWHLLQRIMFGFIYSGVSLIISKQLEYSSDVIETVCSFIILMLVFTIPFEILYKKITTNENS